MSWRLVPSKLVDTVAEINWSLRQFAMFLLGEVWPLKGQKYVEDRFHLIKDIEEDKRNGRSVHLIYVLLVLSILLSIVQCLHTEPTFMLITFDFFGYNKMDTGMKLTKALVNITTYAFYQELYFDYRKTKTLITREKILTHNERRIVHNSNFDFWKLVRWTLMFYQVLVVGFELGMLFCFVQLCLALSAHTFDQLYLWPLAYLSMSIGFVLHSATCLLICVGGFMGCLGLFWTKVVFEQLSIQSRRYLQHPIDRFTAFRLLRYRADNVKCMKGQFESSKMFGKLLLTFLWTNIPMNVVIITLLILNRMPNAHMFYFGLVTSFGQITVIIFFHFVAAMITKRIHQPYKTINSQFVRYRNSTLYSHVRVATNIQAFLVKKRYGVTYQQLGMNFGLVSLSTFFKFVFVYMEMLIFGLNMYLNSK